MSDTPGHIEFVKRNLSESELKIVDITINKINIQYRKNVSAHRQKINIICQVCLENLETHDTKFHIPEIIERYRESINPVKALYYDLQEILFLYEDKPKNKHHKFLISKFSKTEDFEDILVAVNNDLASLESCKIHVVDIKQQYKIPGTSEYYKRVIDIYNETTQWKNLFERFPDWVNENSEEHTASLLDTLRKFFK